VLALVFDVGVGVGLLLSSPSLLFLVLNVCLLLFYLRLCVFLCLVFRLRLVLFTLFVWFFHIAVFVHLPFLGVTLFCMSWCVFPSVVSFLPL
jgi:hypothetical protein